MTEPPMEDGWQRWRGEKDVELRVIRGDVGEIKVALADHIKDENATSRIILAAVLTLLVTAGVAILVYVLNRL
jgi:hypothetical protein